MRKIELLAPAGNFECLIAAVQNGADAVYLAGKNFGARSFADNFDIVELENVVDYCHLRGVRVYVTVNTLVLDDEFSELIPYITKLYIMGVDALIVQDLGVMEVIRKHFPDFPIHASTQMTIHNHKGVSFLERYNVKRVVLSRELSLSDINSIAEKTDMELEVFGHGALCMSFSGQCLLSSIIGGRSGNRGKCAQPCRLPYSVNNQKNKSCVMSLKDLSSLEHLEKLSKIGVTSLKIEGRMKGPAYVAAVVRIYRKYIDNPQKVSKEDYELLDCIFNRGGLTDAYLTGKTGRNMFALDKPDNPYLKGNSSIEKNLLHSLKAETKKIKVNGKFTLKKDEKPVFCIWNDRVSAMYTHSEIPEQAQKSEITEESASVQLRKTGGTPIEFDNIETEIDKGLFVSAGELNRIRREAIEMFENSLKDSFKRKFVNYSAEKNCISVKKNHTFVCEVTNVKQFEAIKDFGFELFYIPIGLLRANSESFIPYKEKIVIVLPAILRENEYATYTGSATELLSDGYHGILIHNLSMIDDFKEYNMYGGYRMNVFNSRSLGMLSELNLKICELSPELTLKQIKRMETPIPAQVMVYGRLPLTVSENCLIRNGDKCPCDNKNSITDRLGMRFPVIKDGDICRSVILNCKKTFLGFDMEKIIASGVSSSRMYFTDEEPEECIRICKTFFEGGDYRPEDFTNGHFFKGVN